MKKLLSMVLVVIMVVILSLANAEDLGIQIIDGLDSEVNAMSFDDMKLGTSYTLDSYAIVTIKELKTVDCFAQFGESGEFGVYRGDWGGINTSYAPVYSYSDSKHENNSWKYVDASWMDSGESADFIWVLTDITNLKKAPVDFTEEASVKIIYQDEYEFNGWIRQIVYDHMEAQNGDKSVSRYGYDTSVYPTEIVMNPNIVEAIEMMYTGTYVFGCTLPNYVVNDKKGSLKMVIEIGGNELTYIIRK